MPYESIKKAVEKKQQQLRALTYASETWGLRNQEKNPIGIIKRAIKRERKAQLDKDVEALKSDREKSADREKKLDPKLKVRINEKNCVLYETNDAPTLDEQDENEENAVGDLY